jgi:hypothetical protein
MEGLRFVFRSPLIRSTMLLDFFATFFSSAMALLPIFAQDILQRRRQRVRLAVCGPRRRRVRDERGDGAAHRADQSPRADAVVGGRDVRAGDRPSSVSRARSG